MNKTLTRSIGFWLLLLLSLGATAVGGWLISGQLGTMTSTLTDGTATGVEVYVGQSLVVVGSALLGAGVIGLLLTLGLTAVQALMPSAAAPVDSRLDGVVADDLDHADDASRATQVTETVGSDDASDAGPHDRSETEDDQNGSSGSTATATKISVK